MDLPALFCAVTRRLFYLADIIFCFCRMFVFVPFFLTMFFVVDVNSDFVIVVIENVIVFPL